MREVVVRELVALVAAALNVVHLVTVDMAMSAEQWLGRGWLYADMQEEAWWSLHCPSYWTTRCYRQPVCASMCDDETSEHSVGMSTVAGVLAALQPHEPLKNNFVTS